MVLIVAALGNQFGRLIILLGIILTFIGLSKYKKGDNLSLLLIGLTLFIGSFIAYLTALTLVFGAGSVFTILDLVLKLNIIQGRGNELTPVMLTITEVVRVIILAALVMVIIFKNTKNKKYHK